MSFPNFLVHLPRRRDLGNGRLPKGSSTRFWISAMLNQDPYGFKPDISEGELAICHTVHEGQYCEFRLPVRMAIPLIIISGMIDEAGSVICPESKLKQRTKTSDIMFDTWWVACEVRDELREAAVATSDAGDMTKSWIFVNFDELCWILWHGFPPTENGIKLYEQWCSTTGRQTPWGCGKLVTSADWWDWTSWAPLGARVFGKTMQLTSWFPVSGGMSMIGSNDAEDLLPRMELWQGISMSDFIDGVLIPHPEVAIGITESNPTTNNDSVGRVKNMPNNKEEFLKDSHKHAALGVDQEDDRPEPGLPTMNVNSEVSEQNVMIVGGSSTIPAQASGKRAQVTTEQRLIRAIWIHRGDMKNEWVYSIYKSLTIGKTEYPTNVVINGEHLTSDEFMTLKHTLNSRLCEKVIRIYCHILKEGMSSSPGHAVIFSPELSKAYEGSEAVSYARQMKLDNSVARLADPYKIYMLPWVVRTGEFCRIDSVIVLEHIDGRDLDSNKLGVKWTRHQFIAKDRRGQDLQSDVTNERVLEVVRTLYLGAQQGRIRSRECLVKSAHVLHKCESTKKLDEKRHDASVDALTYIAQCSEGKEAPKEDMERKRAYIAIELLYPFINLPRRLGGS